MRLSIVSAGVLFSAALFFSGCGEDSNPSVKMDSVALESTILHFNDHHGHLDESVKKLNYGGNIGKVYTQIGGFPRIAQKANEIKASKKNVLFMGAGDAFSGTLYHTLFQGQASVDLMNSLQLDAFTLGNHEFDGGDETLKKFIDKANFPIVSGNVVAKKGSILDGAWTPYIIKEIDGAKLGIIGLEIAQKTEVSSRPSDAIEFLDEVTTVQKYADELKAKGVNKIVLLSHYGYKNDLDLASQVSGIDVIIDGDSHALMGDFSALSLTSQVPVYPKAVTSKSGEPMCIAQAWAHSLVLGEVDVSFSKDGKLTKCVGTPHLLIGDTFKQKDASGEKVTLSGAKRNEIVNIIDAHDNLSIVAKDSKLQEKLSDYKAQVDAKKNDPIGVATDSLNHIRIPTHTYGGVDGASMPLGSDIAPLVSKAFYEASLRADACIQNAGGVRVSIPAGNISYGDAYTLLPFSNTLFEIDMTGAQIKQVLEDAIINYKDNGGSSGSFPYAYGLKYDIDVSKPANSRISNLEIMDRKTELFSNINMAKTYVIVTNNYIAEGRDGYTTFKSAQDSGAKAIDTYLDYAESFVEYVKSLNKKGEGITKLPENQHCIKSYKE